MKIAIYFSLFFLSSLCFGQNADSDKSYQFRNRSKLGGLVAYYFWKENAEGDIIEGSLSRPYRYNEIVVLNSETKPKEKVSSYRVKRTVRKMYHNNSRKKKRFFGKVYMPLRKRGATELSTVQYRFKNGHWYSYTHKNVVYFNVHADSSKRYSHSNDSIVLEKFDVKQKAKGHYMVKTFWDSNNTIIDQQIFAYNGQNVTSYFLSDQVIVPQRILIFSNGYRGYKRNKDMTDNLITKKDRYWYWRKLDKLFRERMEPDNYYYIDGNHHINTSTHYNKANFASSISRVKTLKKKPENADKFHLLNTSPNKEGFLLRKEAGTIAAQAYLSIRCTSPGCSEVKDTIDVVCHSMGYAYALGFLEALRDQVVFGKIYIIAAENACEDGMDWSEFEEVWQYGSNLGQDDADPVWEQDGIAPQCEVKNINSSKIGGRVFLPEYIRKKDFVSSHMLGQYRWIIENIEPGEAGYVY